MIYTNIVNIKFNKSDSLPKGSTFDLIENDGILTLKVLRPSLYTGKVFKVAKDNMRYFKPLEENAPVKKSSKMSELTLISLVKEVISELKNRGMKDLAEYGDSIFAAGSSVRKRRRSRALFQVGKWYISANPRYPIFFIKRFNMSSYLIEIPNPEYDSLNDARERIEQSILVEDMSRFNPKLASKEEFLKTGLEYKPEEWAQYDETTTYTPN